MRYGFALEGGAEERKKERKEGRKKGRKGVFASPVSPYFLSRPLNPFAFIPFALSEAFELAPRYDRISFPAPTPSLHLSLLRHRSRFSPRFNRIAVVLIVVVVVVDRSK